MSHRIKTEFKFKPLDSIKSMKWGTACPICAGGGHNPKMTICNKCDAVWVCIGHDKDEE